MKNKIELTYFENNKVFTKYFNKEIKMVKFLRKKQLLTFSVNGWWFLYTRKGGGIC